MGAGMSKAALARAALIGALGVAGSAATATAEFLPQTQEPAFEGRLILKDVAAQFVDAGRYDPGHTEFELVEDYTFIDAQGRRWTAPKGAVVDGASIPQVVWSWIGGPWSGAYRNAAVIHDWMCEQQIETSDITHRVFHDALLASGVSERLSWIMYQAVLRGGPQWERDAFAPSPVRRPGLTAEAFDAILKEAETGELPVD